MPDGLNEASARRTPPNIVGVLLAAGRSVRFGDNNKLLQDFGGHPLCRYAAQAMLGAGLSANIAVVREDAVAAQLAGFEIFSCSDQQSDSLKTGVRAAMARGADQIVICLADMPFVTSGLIAEVIARGRPICGCVSSGGVISPPAVFHRERFDDLLALTGDKGAGALLKSLPAEAVVSTHVAALVDLDHFADFATYAAYLEGP